jgi:hypothetical protein
LNISLFDQARKDELSSFGEAVRLSNELRATPSFTFTNINGEIITVPAKWGFNCETAEYSNFTTWLNSGVKKSESLFWFTIRIMAWRFPLKHLEIKNNLAPRRQFEFELILSQMKKESEWVGTVGYSNMVRLDKSLDNKKNKIIKGNRDNYSIVRK